jgi:hypothetical protein
MAKSIVSVPPGKKWRKISIMAYHSVELFHHRRTCNVEYLSGDMQMDQ